LEIFYTEVNLTLLALHVLYRWEWLWPYHYPGLLYWTHN